MKARALQPEGNSKSKHGRFLRAGGLSLDRYQRSVEVPGRQVDGQWQDARVIELTGTEFRLLEALMIAAPRILERDLLLLSVWKIDHEIKTNRVDVAINGLRRKIGAEFVITVRGGYRLADEAASA